MVYRFNTSGSYPAVNQDRTFQPPPFTFDANDEDSKSLGRSNYTLHPGRTREGSVVIEMPPVSDGFTRGDSSQRGSHGPSRDYYRALGQWKAVGNLDKFLEQVISSSSSPQHFRYINITKEKGYKPSCLIDCLIWPQSGLLWDSLQSWLTASIGPSSTIQHRQHTILEYGKL